MSEWKTKKLQEICDVRDGTHESPKYHDFGIPFITSKNLKSNTIDFTDVSYISLENHKLFSQRSKVEKGDILFAMIGTVGNPVLVKVDKEFSIKNVALLKFGHSEELLNYFALQVLKSEIILKQFSNKSDGGVQSFVSLSTIRNLQFSVPSITQQRKIAHILTTCDTVIEQTQSAIAKYKAIKQGLLHDLFTRGLDANGHLRPSYQEAPGLYKESELGMIPKEWEVKSLEEIAIMKSGDGITSQYISNTGDFPVCGGNGLRGFTTTFTHEGDYVLIGRQGALCGNITRVSNKFFASEHAVVVTVNKDIDVDWLSQKLDAMNLNQYSEASAQPGLAVAKILRLFIAKPQHNEQKEIGKRLLALDNKMNAEETLLQKYQSIKRGLMGDLLGGRKMVGELGDVVT